MASKRVTVFGGSGFLGRRIVKCLAAEGVGIRVAVRHPERASFLERMGRDGQIERVCAVVRWRYSSGCPRSGGRIRREPARRAWAMLRSSGARTDGIQTGSAQAFKHFDTANRIGAQTAPENVVADRALNNVERDGLLLTPEFLDSWIDAPIDPAIEPPVFLVGFPRSGTTLLDQILDGHPRLQVMEEKPALFDIRSTIDTMPGGYPSALASLKETDIQNLRDRYLRNVERHIDRRPGTILVDKLPVNICSIPLIVRLFPNSRIILALRHPCDVVLSNFMQDYKLNDAMANFLAALSIVRKLAMASLSL